MDLFKSRENVPNRATIRRHSSLLCEGGSVLSGAKAHWCRSGADHRTPAARALPPLSPLTPLYSITLLDTHSTPTAHCCVGLTGSLRTVVVCGAYWCQRPAEDVHLGRLDKWQY